MCLLRLLLRLLLLLLLALTLLLRYDIVHHTEEAEAVVIWKRMIALAECVLLHYIRIPAVSSFCKVSPCR